MTDIDGGTIQIKSMVENIPTDKLVWVSFGGADKTVPLHMLRFTKLIISSQIYNRYVRYFFSRSFFRILYFKFIFIAFPELMKKKVLNFIEAHGIEKIWIHMSGQTIHLAKLIMEQKSIPLHLSLQDDIDGHLDKQIADIIRYDFYELLKKSDTCDVASKEMSNYYYEKYNCRLKSKEVIIGSRLQALPDKIFVKDTFKSIAFAGNLWAIDAFICFADAIKLLNKERSLQNKVSIHFYSQKYPIKIMVKYSFVQYMGLLNPQELPFQLQKHDLLYLPMSFSREKSILSRTSSPSKIITYMQSQVPIISHGPDYASNIGFVTETEIGLAITSTNPDEVAKLIIEYENDFNLRQIHSNNARTLIIEKYDSDKVTEKFVKYLYNNNN